MFGLYAFVAFCLVLALLLPALGISLSFLAAVTGAVLVQFLSRVAVQRA
jgi:hypothetical protein